MYQNDSKNHLIISLNICKLIIYNIGILFDVK